MTSNTLPVSADDWRTWDWNRTEVQGGEEVHF